MSGRLRRHYVLTSSMPMPSINLFYSFEPPTSRRQLLQDSQTYDEACRGIDSTTQVVINESRWLVYYSCPIMLSPAAGYGSPGAIKRPLYKTIRVYTARSLLWALFQGNMSRWLVLCHCLFPKSSQLNLTYSEVIRQRSAVTHLPGVYKWAEFYCINSGSWPSSGSKLYVLLSQSPHPKSAVSHAYRMRAISRPPNHSLYSPRPPCRLHPTTILSYHQDGIPELVPNVSYFTRKSWSF
jgi:hypothetical protein